MPQSTEDKRAREVTCDQQSADPLKDVFQSGEQPVSARSPEAVSERQYELLSELLEEARMLGLAVEDARPHGGQIRVSFSARPDAAIRSIARKLMNAGFTLHLGNTYVK
mgnify:FL=1